jgi:hypothetical protein
LTHEGNAGMGVSANQVIRKGAMVGLFGSELTSPEEARNLLDPQKTPISSGTRWRNWGNMVNDGLPNALVFPCIRDGVEFVAFIALRDIQPGERIHLAYHFSNPVKWEPREELNLEEILTFFSTPTSLKAKWKKMADYDFDNKDPEVEFEGLAKRANLSYVYHSPSLLLSQIVSGHFNLDSAESLLKDVLFRHVMDFKQKDGPALQKYYEQAFQVIRRFLPKAPQVLRQQVAQALLSNVRPALLALTWIVQKQPEQAEETFKEMYEHFEALLSAWESRGNFEQNLQRLEMLAPEEILELIDMIEKANLFLFEREKDQMLKVNALLTMSITEEAIPADSKE